MLKMSGNLVSYFALLLLLLALLMSCGGVSGDAAETTISYTWRDMTDKDGTLSSLRGPSVVNPKDGMVVVAEGHIKKSDGDTEITGVMSRIVEERGDETRTEISLTAGDVKNGTKILEDTPTKGGTKTHNVMGPTTVVAENNIYMLLTKGSAKGKAAGKEGNSLLFVSGTLSGAGDGTKKQVTWGDTKIATLPSTPAYLKELVTSGGSGIAMEKDNRVAFPIQATKTNGENVLLVMHGSVNDNKWELSKEIENVEDCSDPAIVEWEEGNKFLMITPCAKGSYDVYESTVNGKGWHYTDVPLNRVWGTSQRRQGKGVRTGFITATIDGKKVMLVTLPTYTATNDGKEKGRLHLWVSDNIHVYDVGPVSNEGDDVASSSLLYTQEDDGEKLIAVYEKKDSDASTVTNLVSVRLTEQLRRIKTVVKSWEETEKHLKECKKVTGSSPPQQGMCSGPVITEGMVGVLSGKSADDNVWKDEYLCVNATVKGAKKISNGFRFEGSGAGAEWPVGKLGQNQPYYFANNEFTLVATVTIHEEPTADSSPIPLIGVKMNDATNKVLFGLSYTHDNKWRLIFNGTDRKPKVNLNWAKDRSYHVALQMDVSNWYVYFEGISINVLDEEEEDDDDTGALNELFQTDRISHFHIGGDGTNGATVKRNVTVTNVMLYNWLLKPNDMSKLVDSKVIIPPPVTEKKPKPPKKKQAVPKSPTTPVKDNAPSVPEKPQAKPGSKPDEGNHEESQTGTSTNQTLDVKPQAATENESTVKEEQTTQSDVKNSEKPAPGEDASPQVEEKEEDRGGMEREAAEEHDGTKKNNTALPPSDAQKEQNDGVDNNNGPGLVPPPVPVNGAVLNNTVQQPENQEAKPSESNPRPSNNVIGDGTVPICVPHGFLLLLLLGLFGIWDFVLRHPM